MTQEENDKYLAEVKLWGKDVILSQEVNKIIDDYLDVIYYKATHPELDVTKFQTFLSHLNLECYFESINTPVDKIRVRPTGTTKCLYDLAENLIYYPIIERKSITVKVTHTGGKYKFNVYHYCRMARENDHWQENLETAHDALTQAFKWIESEKGKASIVKDMNANCE